MISRSLQQSYSNIKKKLKLMKYERRKIKVITYPNTNQVIQNRKVISQALLQELNSLSPLDVITSDESWFFLDYQHEWMWIKEKNEVEEVERKFPKATKFMVCIFWNFCDLLFIYILDRKQKFNSQLVINTLIPQ
jgi:hypothetical protein